MQRKKIVRIGNASGYWGDDPSALKRQVEHGNLDYITMDFLAEITMSILQKQYERNPELGYARDFVGILTQSLPQILTKKIKVISNAGGINPVACAKAIEKIAHTQGLKPKIAIVMGDNILGDLDQLYPSKGKFENLETSEPFDLVKSKIKSANVYFGALPIVEALKKWDPDIIITGRATDTGITLAPMIYEFAWDVRDWDKLASGIVAGHMLECGCQITGGNFSDWQAVKDYHEMGYPVAEVSPDGTFVLTKHEQTGGFISVDTVREQVFYEMGDPKYYITPDVVADFSTINLKQQAPDRVSVFGIKGFEPTSQYKVSMAYDNGYKAVGSIIVSGPDAKAKADRFAEILWHRSQDTFDKKETEYIGWNACHRSLGLQEDCSEILLRLGVRSQDENKVKRFSRLVSSLILSGPPGVSVLGGVPRVQKIVNYWPALMAKDLIKPKTLFFQNSQVVDENECSATVIGNSQARTDQETQTADKPTKTIQESLREINHPEGVLLSLICLARSGDKGDSVNIGLLARGEKTYAFIKEYFTAQKIKNLFQELCEGKVTRYSLDGLLGLNFILEKSLGGGGSCTLRTDAQGKTFSQALLRQKINIPDSLKDEMLK